MDDTVTSPLERDVNALRSNEVEADQQALMARIEETTRWLKRVLDHQSSKDTADFRAMACEKLLRSEKYGPVMREDPRQLMGMVPRMMRRILADDARRAGAARRPPRRRAVDIEEYPVAAPADAERELVARRRMERLEEELDAFERGETSARVRAKNRAPMVRAVRLKRLGWTDADIAAELSTSKPTINAWLQVMTAHLAVRLAQEEGA
jgi:hypothetical protein